MSRLSRFRYIVQLLMLLAMNAVAYEFYDLSPLLETRQEADRLFFPDPAYQTIPQQNDPPALLFPDFYDNSNYTVEIFFPDKSDREFIFILLMLEDEASPGTINLLPESCVAETTLIACYTDKSYLKLMTIEALQTDQPYEWRVPSSILPAGLADSRESAKAVDREAILAFSNPWGQFSPSPHRMVEVFMYGHGSSGGGDEDDKSWKSISITDRKGWPKRKDDSFYQRLLEAIESSQLLTQGDLEDWYVEHDISRDSLLDLIEHVKPKHPLIVARNARGGSMSERAEKRKENRKKRRSAQYPAKSPRAQGYSVFVESHFISTLVSAYNNNELNDDCQISIFCNEHDVDEDEVKLWIVHHKSAQERLRDLDGKPVKRLNNPGFVMKHQQRSYITYTSSQGAVQQLQGTQLVWCQQTAVCFSPPAMPIGKPMLMPDRPDPDEEGEAEDNDDEDEVEESSDDEDL